MLRRTIAYLYQILPVDNIFDIIMLTLTRQGESYTYVSNPFIRIAFM